MHFLVKSVRDSASTGSFRAIQSMSLFSPTRGNNYFGEAIVEQQYSKSNLVSVPPQDRILIPKPYWQSARDYQNDEGDSDNEDNDAYWKSKYANHLETLGRQVPLAVHRAPHGGQVAYLGFVNGDGHIPEFVRALCTRTKTSLS